MSAPPLRSLHRLAAGIERTVDSVRRRVKERRGGYGPLEILGFRGHGTASELRVQGRVLEDRQLPQARDEDTFLDNLVATWRRIETDEVPDVPVLLSARGAEVEVVTDAEGYFQARIVADRPVRPPTGWEEVDVRVPDVPERGILGSHGTIRARVPAPEATFGILSDIDDTILRTGVTDLVTLLRHTLFHNARTRVAFPGVAAFYRALAEGPPGQEEVANPVFYVSSGPWNFYDLVVEFMEHRKIPAGPVFMQDVGLDVTKFGFRSHLDHKMACIEGVLDLHHHLPFVLLGDSGQHDPEVYKTVVERYPGRVLAIYIRDVSVDARDRVVVELAERMRDHEVDLVLVENTLEAAEHAADLGLIRRERLVEVARAVEEDEAA